MACFLPILAMIFFEKLFFISSIRFQHELGAQSAFEKVEHTASGRDGDDCVLSVMCGHFSLRLQHQVRASESNKFDPKRRAFYSDHSRPRFY